MKNKRKFVALSLIFGPIIGMMLILTAYAVNSFVSASSNTPINDEVVTTAELVNVALGFFGVIMVLLMAIGIPIGVYMLVSKVKTVYKHYDLRRTANFTMSLIAIHVTLQTVLGLTIYTDFDEALLLFTKPLVFIPVTITVYAVWISYLVWLYQANSNLQVKKIATKYTPGWVVIGHFLPFINFFIPPVALIDIDKSSAVSSQSSNKAIILVWWSVYISTILASVTLHNVMDFNRATVITTGMGVLSYCLLFIVIQKITRKQLELTAK